MVVSVVKQGTVAGGSRLGYGLGMVRGGGADLLRVSNMDLGKSILIQEERRIAQSSS